MGKVVKKVALVAGAIGLVATGIGAVAVAGAGIAGIGSFAAIGAAATAASGILSLGGSLLSPKAKAPQASEAQADRLTASIDLRARRKIAFGYTALATDIRDQEYTDDQTMLHRFVVCASHRSGGIDAVFFDDVLAWTLAGGAQGEYAGYLTITPVLEGSAANAINISSRMGTSRRYTGCAYLHIRYKLTGADKNTESPFAQSIPSRITIRGWGMPLYDPRRDSTRGGAGAQRADDQTTWEWDEDAARSPALQTLTFLLGWRIRNPVSGDWKLAVGKGIPADRFNYDSFITAANMCDEAVAVPGGGTEPRYRSDGVFSEGDDPTLVLDNLKASMNATLDDLDGEIGITILHDDLATPIADFSDDDILGGFQWSPSPPLGTTPNRLLGSFTDASDLSLYQPGDIGEIGFDRADGIDDIEPVHLALVQSRTQGIRLLTLRVQRTLYPGTFKAEFQFTAWKVRKGDVIRLSFGALGWWQKLFRVIEYDVRVDGVVPMTLREEHADVYAAYSDAAAAIVPAEPTRYDRQRNPIVRGILDAGTTAEWPLIADPAGTKPDDNATNSGDPNTPFGVGGTVGDALEDLNEARDRLDAAEAEIGVQQQVATAADLAQRQAEAGAHAIAEALLRSLTELNRQRENMRDAGFVVDPETGQVRIYGIDQANERIATAEVVLDGVVATILTKASVSYVNQAITEALFDPSQIADLDTIFVRLSAAETEIDGLNAAISQKAELTVVTALSGTLTSVSADLSALTGTVATKASQATVDALGTRVTEVEETLGALGDTGEVVGIRTEIRQARFIADATAENALWALLNADAAKRGALAQLAAAREELTTTIRNGLSAEAAQRLLLAVRMASAESTIVSEQIARTTGDAALAMQFTSLSATLSGLAATVSSEVERLDQADVTEQEARASAIAALTASLSGALSAAVTTINEAIATGDSANASSITSLSTTVGAHSTTLTTYGASIDGIKARYGALFDVDGRITGFELLGGGGETDANFLVDTFRISSPGSGAGTEFSDGNWRVYDEAGDLVVRLGVW